MTSSHPHASVHQEQFLTVLSREAAIAAFDKALQPKPLRTETIALARALGRVLAQDIHAPVDTPPFDRAVVDGFALIAGDVAQASAARPVRLALNPEIIAAGVDPKIAVRASTATPVSTGGPVPRGADAVVMVEHTDSDGEGAIIVTRPVAPGQNIAFAGSDIARGQTLLRKGQIIGAREIGMLAAVGLGEVPVWCKPRIAVLSTGDELVPPGAVLKPAQIYDSNGPIVAAALEENGCDAIFRGVIQDEPEKLRTALRVAFAECDGMILSGGTSKGAGDLTYRLIGDLGAPGIVVHGVALKPGKPLCLAVCDGKPVVALPGFPTSAMFTFHDIVAPFMRRLAGLPPREERQLQALVPQRVASEIGRTEFVMVALSENADGLVAHPVGKGSGAVTAFSQADGFIAIDALSDAMPAQTMAPVRLFTPHIRVPDLAIMGSHCVGLDAVAAQLHEQGISSRILALGSQGGLAALKRGECDVAPIHLLDLASGAYNIPFLDADMELIPGWRRMQGFVYRKGDARFEGRALPDAVSAALADPHCIMVNRNNGAGTRTLIDGLLRGARPPGFWNQPRSHNAVAASVAQGRADWGVAIKPLADAFGLRFIPVADEHYDLAVRKNPRHPGHIAAVAEAVRAAHADLLRLGFTPA